MGIKHALRLCCAEPGTPVAWRAGLRQFRDHWRKFEQPDRGRFGAWTAVRLVVSLCSAFADDERFGNTIFSIFPEQSHSSSVDGPLSSYRTCLYGASLSALRPEVCGRFAACGPAATHLERAHPTPWLRLRVSAFVRGHARAAKVGQGRTSSVPSLVRSFSLICQGSYCIMNHIRINLLLAYRWI